ncbi:MAG: M20/M25/M40 family metallo-hydrolase [Synergistaceae bacterium]|nr:M20/M25/M40 family metallo-hydrolase [Synergistaceae bacterium]
MNFRDKTGERAYSLLLELAAIPSVTGSDGGEEACAAFIRDHVAKIPYFAERPEDMHFIPVGPDNRRHAVAALLRAERETKKTVILTGHFDVVDAESCGPLKQWAFSPLEYTERVGSVALSDDARADLESGHWLFGRGVSDMKTGVALNICLLEDYAEARGQLGFNVLLLLVPDEEGDSAGMRGSVPFLAQLQRDEGLEFAICVDTEPVFESADDKTGAPCPTVFYGSIGKLMPLFMCVGRESHAGEYDQGLNSALIASYLIASLEGRMADTLGDQSFPPMCCLRVKDMRSAYSVTLPERTVLYFNCLTVRRTPDAVFNEMKERAMDALWETLAHLRHSGWEPRVLTVAEVMRQAAEKDDDALLKTMLDLTSADERERNIEALSCALDLLGEKGPLVVVGFVPPVYPPRLNENASPAEMAIRAAVPALREHLNAEGFGLREAEVFQGITDMSFTGFRGAGLDSVAKNIPLWGRDYALPIEELRKLDIPFVIFGPMGKDAHKLAERVELNFAFNVLPSVLPRFLSSVTSVSCA